MNTLIEYLIHYAIFSAMLGSVMSFGALVISQKERLESSFPKAILNSFSLGMATAVLWPIFFYELAKKIVR